MAAVRSSPRLRALLCSDPSGKPAVFAPRLNRVNTSDRTLRSRNAKSKLLIDSGPSSPSKLSRGKKPSEKRPVVSKMPSKGIKSKGGASENALVRKRRHLDSSEKRQQRLTPSAKAQIASKKSRSGRMLEAKSVEMATRCKQRKSNRVLASSANNLPNLEHDIADSVTGTGDMSTCVSIKRKRGRPPNNTNCKRMKITPMTRKSEVDTERPKPVVIDLTCDNETIGEDDTDAMITLPILPPSFTDLDFSQTSSGADSPSLVLSLEASKDQYNEESVDGDCGVNITSTDVESDYLTCRTSLDSDETIAQLFDLGTKEGHTTSVNDSSESETVTIPSLKRSKNIESLATTVDVTHSEQTSEMDNSNSDTPDTISSPTEEEYPQPSTPQQKLIRRLARQKQLEEMRAKEAAHSREERLLRRKGVLPDTKAMQGSSAKRISWRDETDLVEMFIYSPVRDDDDDTVSIHSDDACNMELTLLAT